MSAIDEEPQPQGELELKVIAMPADTNPYGDIFGGWLLSQMDLAASNAAIRTAQGRVATIGVGQTGFMVAVKVGAIVACYCQITNTGRSSIGVSVEVWVTYPETNSRVKVTECEFVFVAIDDKGRTRALPTN